MTEGFIYHANNVRLHSAIGCAAPADKLNGSDIEIIYLPPYTPEINPVGQIWKEIRMCGFRNELFQSLEQLDS